MKYLLTIFSISGLALLIILIKAISNTEFLSSDTFQLLLNINLIFALFLGILIIYQIYKLFKDIKREITGSKLTLRLVASYSVMMLIPVMIVYLVSVNFLTRSIESWFNVKVEAALEGGLNIGQKTLDIMMKDIELKTRSIAYSIRKEKVENYNNIVSDLREKFDIDETLLIDESKQIIGISSKDTTSVISELPSENDLDNARFDFHGRVDMNENSELILKGITPINFPSKDKKLYLFVSQKVPPQISKVALSVESVFEEYQALTYSRNSLRLIYQITLTLILLLAILGSIAVALFFSKRFTMPLSVLAEATKDIADGNYRKKIPEQGKDELGLLVRSFNVMTSKLEDANKTLELNRKRIEDSSKFLENIITNMSSAIIVLDEKSRIRFTNRLASQYLGLNLEKKIGQIFNIKINQNKKDDDLINFINRIDEILKKEKRNSSFVWRRDSRIISVQISNHNISKSESNKIIVMDDITEITQAQRNEAWSEVARRLAHEIKNPLTPIQLSAEQISYKFAKELNDGDRKILNERVKTIVNQVNAIKDMVNEFTEFSKATAKDKKIVNLKQLLDDVINLYHQKDIKIINTAKNIKLMGDETKLRQVFLNLIQNAYEAKQDNKNLLLNITSTELKNSINIFFIDNGSGLKKNLDIFEPYVTSKETGTGLGLAVVKKIIEEHNGKINIKNNKKEGVEVKISFDK
ncbi:MAG: ATP-binding protein [Nitrosomonadales bacterium]